MSEPPAYSVLGGLPSSFPQLLSKPSKAEGNEPYVLQVELSLNCLLPTYCWGFLAGLFGYACYISGCGLTRKGQDKSVVCMVNSKNTISTWDVHKVSLVNELQMLPSYEF